MDHTWNFLQAHHILPLWVSYGVSYGVGFVSILEKMDHVVSELYWFR